MLEPLISWIIDYIRFLGGIGVLLGVLIETFIAPIPSPLIPVASGSILISSEFSLQEAIITSFSTIALFGSVGATAGAFFGYAIGYYGGRPFIEKYGLFLGITWDDIKKLEKKLGSNRMKNLSLISARAAPIIPLSPVSFFAGFIRFNIFKFSFLTFLGCLPRYFFLGLVGWWAGITYYEFVKSIGFMEDLVLILIITIVIGYFVFYKIRSKRAKNH
jgi:membrane protein DedA with SNARE-associated domain